jgi:hypothetical protein
MSYRDKWRDPKNLMLHLCHKIGIFDFRHVDEEKHYVLFYD